MREMIDVVMIILCSAGAVLTPFLTAMRLYFYSCISAVVMVISCLYILSQYPIVGFTQ